MSRIAELRSTVQMIAGLCATVAALLLADTVTALPDDRLQAIEITAARAVRDERAGFTVYSGDVIMQQGSLHIEADKITIFHDSEAADRIIAVGAPATLRQQPEIGKGFVTASAGRIVYEKSREWVQLRESAVIEQDGAVVSGESIDYFMAEQRVRADAAPENANGRVQVIIPAAVIEAETQEDEDDNPPDKANEGEANGDPDGA
ncbi:lipopolysaccharide transport periplasmic protein LptA [Congregibacter variabilis]|uniref:Lipopolysaccharide export system protein LptA n=1 Tax=Congregibacter variabilis TaxID=3081200 RepID=A0ABZ0I7G1_9GAMM|nr:lipopolysaccharide transport periplasmic protein LptA [Congregibacter sp. IMCC43200]